MGKGAGEVGGWRGCVGKLVSESECDDYALKPGKAKGRIVAEADVNNKDGGEVCMSVLLLTTISCYI